MSTSQRYRYSTEQLKHILDQAGIYMCACPAQVATQMLELRKLHQYQLTCMDEMPQLADTHRRIAEAAEQAHAVLEAALDDVLRIEGWDEQSLTMPDGLRALRDSLL